MSKTESEPVRQGFQAEVRQLLDIVIHSLYTDREIFVRELVSNASDALEKLRLLQLTEKHVFQPGRELEITISVDEPAGTVTIADSGVGMTRDELVEHLGTIAKSGTRAFLDALKEKGTQEGGMIGQFGVGFYSAFMVASRVDVYTRAWQAEGQGWKWSSEGEDGYTIEEAPEQDRGTRIVLHLRDDRKEFANEHRLRAILQRYSNFVAFPIVLGGERVNTIQAVWVKPKAEVTEDEYREFYRFTAHATDDPKYTMHFQADAPLEIHALLFVPGENQERFGFGQMEPGVALHCRRVLIDAHPKGLLPEWLRFLRGVIDSADLPLNISRESMQDSALVRKIGGVVTKRFLSFLEKQAGEDPEKYRDFHATFGRFLKEGIAGSPEHREAIAKLLRFESTMTDAGETTSFAEYALRSKEEGQPIYFLVGPSREVMESGPYLEAFRQRGLEVAFFTDSVDEYVLDMLGKVDGRDLIPADRADLDLGEGEPSGDALPEEQATALCGWWKEQSGETLEGVTTGKRLVDSPAAALVPGDAPNAHMRAMMRAMGQEPPPVKAKLEINTGHPLIKQLATLREAEPELAADVARQISDQALLAAGLVDHPQQVATRMNALLEKVLGKGA